MSTNWLITGTSSGLGRLMTEQLLGRGDRVVATVRDADALADLRATAGDRLTVAELDVTDVPRIRTVVDEAFATLGRIDVVVSNAGYGLFGAVEEPGDDQIRHQLDTNLLGPIHLIRAALPHLRAQGSGRIVQVSSAGGQTTYPNFSYYHASKWGIEGFCETIAQEIAPFGIELTIVEPGATATNFGAGLVAPPVMEAYDQTPAGDIRRALRGGTFAPRSDPHKTVRAIIDSVDQTPAPLRLTLGQDAFTDVRASLARRLAALEAQEELALSNAAD